MHALLFDFKERILEESKRVSPFNVTLELPWIFPFHVLYRWNSCATCVAHAKKMRKNVEVEESWPPSRGFSSKCAMLGLNLSLPFRQPTTFPYVYENLAG